MSKEEDYQLLEKSLDNAIEEIARNSSSKMCTWLIPMCPECKGILGQKFGSTRLVCMKCGKEFKIIEATGIWKPKYATA